ncbi:hypothetical protein V8E36_009547 [Tilletia maclaganii]
MLTQRAQRGRRRRRAAGGGGRGRDAKIFRRSSVSRDLRVELPMRGICSSSSSSSSVVHIKEERADLLTFFPPHSPLPLPLPSLSVSRTPFTFSSLIRFLSLHLCFHTPPCTGLITMFFNTAALLLATAAATSATSSAPTQADAQTLVARFPVLSCTLGTLQRSCDSAYPISYNDSETCCYNGAITAGGEESGLVLQTQFWDTEATSINPGPANSTTVHGLWPDYCSGRYPQFCTADTGIPAYNGSEIRALIGKYEPALLKYMDTTWTDYQDPDPSSFWAHEQNKHATCFSTLRAKCQLGRPGISRDEEALVGYFRETVKRFKQLPTIKWLASAGIVQSNTVQYNLTDVLAVLKKRSGGIPYVGCRKGSAVISEFWYYSYTNGPLIGAVYHPTDTTFNSTCPALVSLPVKYNNATINV